MGIVAGSCAKPSTVGATDTSAVAVTVSSLPGGATSGTLPVVPPATARPAVPPVSLPPRSPSCEAMSRFVQDLFIVEKAKAESPAKKDEILRAVDVHAGELKLNVPALTAGVDQRVAHAKSFLTGTVSEEQKQAEEAQGKAFQEWFKQNGCE